jgi:uncharacterized protein
MRDTVMTALKEAMKSGDKAKVSTLRMMQAKLKDKDIEARGLGKPETSAEEILALYQKMIKERQESAQIYSDNARPELAAQELSEIAIIQAFLPAQMGEDEVKAAIATAISDTGAASMKDMGKVVADLRAKFAGRMDFGKASGLVKAALGG